MPPSATSAGVGSRQPGPKCGAGEVVVDHLCTAATMFREVHIRIWLERAGAELGHQEEREQ